MNICRRMGVGGAYLEGDVNRFYHMSAVNKFSGCT